MSIEIAVLALRLEGPMQSWGHESQFNRRNTALFPTKSAIGGICCAAMGFSRGSEEERVFLEKFIELKLTCIAIPRFSKRGELSVKRMQDYHTVQNTVTAKGKSKNDEAVLTYRQYLNDAGFVAFLEGEKAFLFAVAEGVGGEPWSLQNPKWGVWLGRKACIPTKPVFAGLYANKNEAIAKIEELKGKPLGAYSHVREVDSFGSGIDTIMDQPLCFESTARKFAPRRVKIEEAIE